MHVHSLCRRRYRRGFLKLPIARFLRPDPLILANLFTVEFNNALRFAHIPI